MSVSTTNSTQTFAGGQSVLAFNFRALTSFPQYIQVTAVALTGGTFTALSYGTQYTVTVSSTGVGGTVIVLPTFGTNYNYVVYRQTAILQSSSYTDYNAFPASTLENNLDQLTMIEQEASTAKSLQLTYPIGTATTYSTTFPIPSIGTVVGTDPTGTMFINVPPGPSGSTGAQGPSGATGNIALVSSSTSDITMVSTSTTPIITSVNSGTGSSQLLRTNVSGAPPIFYPTVIISNTQSQNATGGSLVVGSWSTVIMTTKNVDTFTIATLSSSVLTLPSGTYLVTGQCPFSDTGSSQTRLINATGSALLLTGTSILAANATTNNSSSFIEGEIVLASTTNVILQAQGTNNQSSGNCLGLPSNFGTEVYAFLKFIKIL